MKAKYLFLLASIVLASCGVSKQQMQQYPNYGGYQPQPGYYQQGYWQMAEQGYQQMPQQQLLDPSAMHTNISQCERLAEQGWAVNKLRGYGTGKSGNKNMARQRAVLNARVDLASTMKAWVKSYMREYNEDIEQDGVASNEQMFVALQEQTVNQLLEGTIIIFSDVKQSGSTYEYEVCVELDNAKVQEAVLSQAAKEGVRMNADKFREAAQRAWDNMALQEAGYNPAVQQYEQQQQQHQMNMEQQQMNMQQQQLNMQQQLQQYNNQNNQQQQRNNQVRY